MKNVIIKQITREETKVNFSDVRYKEGLNYLLSMQQEKSYHSIY